MRSLTFPERLVNPTFLNRVRLPVSASMVDQLVHLHAEQVIDRIKSQQGCARRIGKRAIAIEIDAVDSLAGRMQQQLREISAIADPARFLP